ncbi:MAG: hypothetical protein ACTSQG_00290 [Promethearchaeota archaeon]
MKENRFAFIENDSINSPLTFISFKELLKNSIRYRSKGIKEINNFFNKSINKLKHKAMAKRRIKEEREKLREEKKSTIWSQLSGGSHYVWRNNKRNKEEVRRIKWK